MKLYLLAVSLALLSPSAFAAKCAYVLDEDEYGVNMSGHLILDGATYRCMQHDIGGNDQLTLCRKADSPQHWFDYVIGMDGGEASFRVYKGLIEERNVVCQGTATVQK